MDNFHSQIGAVSLWIPGDAVLFPSLQNNIVTYTLEAK